MVVTVLKRLTPYLVTLALAGFLYMRADQFGIVSLPGRPGPDLWPKLICVLLAVTSLVGIIGALFGPAQVDTAVADADEALLSPPETHPHLVWFGMGATGVYIAALPWLGFFVATELFAMALLVIGGMRRWILVPLIALGLTSAFTIIFMKVVYVSLPLGVAWFKLISLAVFRLIGVH